MTLSHSMLAIEISAPGGPDVLKPVSVPVPVPGHGQIIIRVAWAGVNRPDALQRAGAYAPPPSASPLPGLECSGTVVEVGPGVTRWQIGDQVCRIFEPDGEAQQAIAYPGDRTSLRPHIGMGHRCGMGQQAFHAAQRFRQREHPRRADAALHRLHPARRRLHRHPGGR